MSKIEVLLERISLLESRLRNNEKQLLTFQQALELLGFSKSHLYRLCYRNLIPHHKPTDRTIYFFKDELVEWVLTNSLRKKKTSKVKRYIN